MKIMDKLFKIYKTILDIHIKIKTVDKVFHEFTADAYELAFDMFHLISEKRQDLEIDKPVEMLEESENEVYDQLEKAKIELEEMIWETNTYGMDNLLRDLYDKLETMCWTARWFLPKEYNNGDEETEIKS